MRANTGDYVKITHSTYSGVTVGEVGVVNSLHDDPATHEPGYGVEFTKFWPQTDINSRPPFATRILWFPIDAAERMTPEQYSAYQLEQAKKATKK